MMRWIYWIFIINLLVACQNQNDLRDPEYPIFKLLTPEESGVSFSNEITPNLSNKENLLDFDYFYNGAGVGIADLNNDGLPDLFFCGNQSENRIYVNKGNLQFEDVTAQSGINIGKHWSNGVTFGDINNDGWLDIYVSQGGPYEPARRSNQLLINNQDLTFTETAEIYGLDDIGISTQSAFFDFDKDGDMDCFVMNESELYGYNPIDFHRLLLENAQQVYPSYSHLYRNDNGYFKDITATSGVTAPSFGLGLTIADINNDDWLDIYVANDYYQPDNLYINRKNGTFSDRAKNHLHQMSFFGMGVDIADINNDGYQDIFVLDMASKDHIRSKTLMASMDVESFDLLVNQFRFPYQYMFNSLQINNGKGIYHNIAQMSGVAKTDWSWAAIMEDYDHDGMKDIFVTNGYRKYGTDNDFKNRVNRAKEIYNGQVPIDVKEELYASIPSERLSNYMFRQEGFLSFSEIQDHWGLSVPTFSNGSATGDLDGDGDLELVINNMDQVAHIYENLSSNRANANYLNIKITDDQLQYAKVTIQYGDQIQFCEVRRVRGYMSSLEPIAHFGIGNATSVDRLEIEFPDGRRILKTSIPANQTIHIRPDEPVEIGKKEGDKSSRFRPLSPLALGITYQHQENEYNDFEKEILLPYKQSTFGPCLAITDLNNDGNDDFYLGGAAGQPGVLYISDGDSFRQLEIPVFIEDEIHEDVAALFLDLNGDQLEELIVISGGNEWEETSSNYSDRVYIQNDSYSFRRMDQPEFSSYNWSGGTVMNIDFDNDGDQDVIVGNRIIPQKYPLAAPSYLFENENGILRDVTVNIIEGFQNAGIINDISVADYNNDQWPDIVVVGEWEKPKLWLNNKGVFQLKEQRSFQEGLWFSVTHSDFDNDGDIDLLLGNIGENYKLKSSPDKPLLIYAGDLDGNGTHDQILSTHYKGEYVPVRGKECSSQQLPFINEKFTTYEDFASSSLVDVYGEDQLTESYQKRITTNSSYIMLNNGKAEFEPHKLPWTIQSFPLLDAVLVDIDKDSFLDIIAAGTIYTTEVETPRLDAGSGVVLRNRNGILEHSKAIEDQLYISGDIKHIGVLNRSNNSVFLLATRNNNTISLMNIFD